MDEANINQIVAQVIAELKHRDSALDLSSVEREPVSRHVIYLSAVTGNAGNIALGSNIRQYVINLVVQQAKIQAVQHAVPSALGIVGREHELGELAEYLEGNTSATITRRETGTTIFGVAGIGKTTLAALYYHRYRDHYAQVYWRNLGTDPLFSGLVGAFAEILGRTFDPREVPNEDNQAMLLINWLRELPEPYLLVLDDCESVLDDEGNAKLGWAKLLVESDLGKARLLLTSRRHVRAERKRVHNYEIEGLSEADGIVLLRAWGLTDYDEGLLRRAVKQAGGHPLALIFLAQLVVEDKLVLEELLARRQLWQREVANNLLDEVYKRLPKRQKQLIRYVSIYDYPPYFRQPVTPKDIAGMLVRHHLAAIADLSSGVMGEESQTQTRLRPNPRSAGSRNIASDAVVLGRRALLTAEQGRYTMHAVVRDYAYAQIPEGDWPRYHHAAAEYWQSLYKRDPKVSPPKREADVQPLLDSFDQLCAAGRFDEADTLLRGLPVEYMSGGEWLSLNDLLYRWSTFARLIAMGERITNAPADAMTANSLGGALGNLGTIYTSVGQYDRAIESHRRALAIAEGTGDYKGSGAELGSLGSAYLSLGQYRQAVDYYLQAEQAARRSGDLQMEANSRSGLGIAYHNLGEYERAISCYEQALDLAAQSGDLQGKGNYLGNLGITYRKLGDYQRAVSYYEQGLAIADELGDLRGKGNRLGNLGNIYRAQGQVQGAIGCYQQALQLDEQIGDRSGQGTDWQNLGISFEQLGRYAEAIACYHNALSIRELLGVLARTQSTQRHLANIRTAVGEDAYSLLEAEAARLAAAPNWRPDMPQDNGEA